MTSKRLDPQQVQAQFNMFKQELQSLAQKIGELETEAEEHKQARITGD